MIKVLLIIKSVLPSRKIRSCLKVLAFKVDINLLNQHYKPADWLADWLTALLRHFDSQGTKSTRQLEYLKHSRHSRQSSTRRALEALRHSKGTRAFKELKALEGHLGAWGTRRAPGHSGTQGTPLVYRVLCATKKITSYPNFHVFFFKWNLFPEVCGQFPLNLLNPSCLGKWWRLYLYLYIYIYIYIYIYTYILLILFCANKYNRNAIRFGNKLSNKTSWMSLWFIGFD